ncbi:MAG: 50S ribosomal protein L13 [Planctomycetes bacterium]|nr:50S ribosomal protein L13 [Planctomycetota bacterium]
MRGSKQKTWIASAKTHQREWWIVDAADKTLGRLATRVAMVLMGKHKPTYTPFLDTGDHVVIVNAEKIRLTGKKPEQKTYRRFSGYPGGQAEVPFKTWIAQHPEEVVRHAVVDMLPRHGLGRRMIFKLQVYRGPEHPHKAQQPKELKIDG